MDKAKPTTSLVSLVYDESPRVALSLRRENKCEGYKRFVQFSAEALFPVNTDNLIRMSDGQINAFMDAILNELRQFLHDGFDPSRFGEKKFVVEPESPEKIDIDDVDELIPVVKTEIGGERVNGVDARLLHEFLEVKTPFDIWIDRRINKYGFVKNTDFSTFLLESSGGRKPTDYFLSIDMAKELAMVENNAKGREARRYFIACEKRLRLMGANGVSKPSLRRDPDPELVQLEKDVAIPEKKPKPREYRKQISDLIAEMEVGDSLRINRVPGTVKNWIDQGTVEAHSKLIGMEKPIPNEFQFEIRPEGRGARIWRVA